MIVTSVPHCGTHFVRDELLKNYHGAIHTVHTYPAAMSELVKRLAIGEPCIVPVRHPITAARSWKHRGKDCLESIPFWERLIDQVDKYEPFYLALDQHLMRGPQLQEISNVLSVELKTDWPVIREAGITDGPRPELTTDEYIGIHNLMSEHAPFFWQWGYD